MIKKVLIVLGVLLLILLGSVFAFLNTGFELPEGSEEITDRLVQAKEIPSLRMGETGYTTSFDGTRIWYESVGDTSNPAVLLIMGYGAKGLAWPNSFIEPIVAADYHVIRYDNRGLGLSDWKEDWSIENPYTLEDMARDGMAVLDELGIARAHIVGASMGGMIAQRVAISHADRAMSLTSIMSSGYYHDPELPQVSLDILTDLTRLEYHLGGDDSEEERIVKYGIGIVQLLQGDASFKLDVDEIALRALYEYRHQGGIHAGASQQHENAIIASGSRLEELGSIGIPTLVIHGKMDPLIKPEHSEKYAPLIPDSELLLIDGMAHLIASPFYEEIHRAMFRLFKKAGKASSVSS